jgi:TetR/AcrR family transcriptional regulator
VIKVPAHPETRRHILQAAARSFASRGYAATSVQEIVDAAQVSKPTLYYYFADKADLFQALVDHAHDERYRLMAAAAAGVATVRRKLENIAVVVFDFALQNTELMRIAFATAFAAGGEVPAQGRCREKGRRGYDFLRSIVEQGQASGELRSDLDADALAMGIYGQLNTFVMVRLVAPDCPLDQKTAHQVVQLFLEGACPGTTKPRTPDGRRSAMLPNMISTPSAAITDTHEK